MLYILKLSHHDVLKVPPCPMTLYLVDSAEETPPAVAPEVSPQLSSVEAPAEAANDNSPVEGLPATGTSE
jgi:hypothetical protein